MKTKKPNRLDEATRMFSGNPVLYHPSMKIITGSVNAALLLCYLLYWQGKGAKGDWTYKTITAIESDTGLSRSNQDSAIRLCELKGLLEVRRRGIPATRHFRVDIIRLTSIILSLQESGKLAVPEAVNSIAGNLQTTTESTAEITTNTKGQDLKINTAGLQRLNELKGKFEPRRTSGFERAFP